MTTSGAPVDEVVLTDDALDQLDRLDQLEPGYRDFLYEQAAAGNQPFVQRLLFELAAAVRQLGDLERRLQSMTDQVIRAGADPDHQLSGGWTPPPGDPLHVHDPIPPQHRPHGAP